MKKITALLLAAVLLLTGCTGGAEATVPGETEPVMEEVALQEIICTPEPYQNSYLYAFRGMDFTEDYHMQNVRIQEAAAQIPVAYPLEEAEQIHVYAWALYRICMEEELFVPELIPQSAERYDEDMWCITFSPHVEPGVLYCGPSAFALVSTVDGHIVAFHYYGDVRGND